MKNLLVLIIIGVFIASMLFMGISCKAEEVMEEEVMEEEVIEEVMEEEVMEEEAVVAAEEPFPSTISGEVEVMSYWTGGIEAEGLELVVNAFMEDYPNIELTIVPKPGDEILTVLQTNLSSNDPVDSYFYWPGSRMKAFVDAGLTAPLTDIFEAIDYDSIAPGVSNWERFPGYGDVPYTVVINRYSFAVWYNVKKFEEAGIEKIPETWDEYLDVCQTLLDAGIYPTATNQGVIGHPHISWFEKFLQRTTPDNSYRQSLIYQEGDWDSDYIREAMGYFDDMAPYWHPDSTSLGYGDVYMMFARGDIAMQNIGSWIIGSYEGEMGMVPFEDYDVFTFPIINPDMPLMETGTSNSICLSQIGLENEEARAWIAYWMTPKAQDIFINHTSNMAAIDSVESKSPMINRVVELMQGRDSYFEFAIPAQIDAAISNEIESRQFDIITTDEFIENSNALYEEYLESLE